MEDHLSVRETLLRLRATAHRVADIESSYPLDNPTFAPPASEVEIASLEELVGPLAIEYRTYLTESNGIIAMDIWNGYHIYSTKLVEQIVRAADIPLQVETAGNDVRTAIPVAGDGGGNQFLLVSITGEIFKWNHDRRDPFETISSSFREFLQRVAEDWEHFVEGDNSWPYISG